MTIYTRFRDCEKCPCPAMDPSDWETLRGREVILGTPLPPAVIKTRGCDSDTFWLILGPEGFLDTDNPKAICRHVLEIGD